MKKTDFKNKILFYALFIYVAIILFACNKEDKKEETTFETQISETRPIKEEAIVKRNIEENGLISEVNSDGDIITTIKLANDKIKTIEYDADDLEEDYNIYKMIEVDLANKNSVALNFKNQIEFVDDDLVIKDSGVYKLSGELNGGQVRVEGDFKGKVEIVLENARIKTNKAFAIYSANDAPLLLKLANGSENYIGTNATGEVLLQYAIFANNTLSLTGNGSLFVDEGFLNAIGSADVLTFISGNYSLFGSVSTISGNTCVIIRSGVYNLLTGNFAIISLNDASGYIYIENGEFDIISKGCGVVATNEIIFAGGKMKIESEKTAVKCKTIDVLSGEFNIKTMEDAIIAVNEKQNIKKAQEDTYIRFTGGSAFIDSWFDGLHSYGDLYLEGGTIYISGPTRHRNYIIKYNGKVVLNGSDVIALGASNDIQDLGDGINQNYIIVYYKERFARQKGSAYQVRDKADNIIMSFTPEKDYRVAIVTSNKFKIGETYSLISRDQEDFITLSDKITIIK